MKASESKMQALIKPCYLSNLDQNIMKNKKVTDGYSRELNAVKVAILVCVTSHSPNSIYINRITSFLLVILILSAFVLILLMKIAFEKKICIVCNVIDLFIFQNLLAGGYKTFFMLNSTENEIYPAHKC